jgi:hypothetical protein
VPHTQVPVYPICMKVDCGNVPHELENPWSETVVSIKFVSQPKARELCKGSYRVVKSFIVVELIKL